MTALLRRRIRTDGAVPLITHYDVVAQTRVELSALTLGNWVAKASNLLAWELSVAPGDRVALPLAVSDPGHWMTAVWQLAVWQVGAAVDLSGSAEGESAVLICGPDWAPYAGGGADVLSCSLHPFATGLGPTGLGPTGLGPTGLGPTGLAASVVDADVAVRGQPDSFSSGPLDPAAPAWIDDERRLTQAELTAQPGSSLRRLLVLPTPSPLADPWPTARDGILAALVGGGSVVTVVGGSPDDVTRIAAAELAVR